MSAIRRVNPRGTAFPTEPEGPNLQDVIDAIAEIKSEMGLLLTELKTIVKLLRDLPIDLDRKDF
jgi:hypothetical protein